MPASNAGSLLNRLSYRLTRTNNKQSKLQIHRHGSRVETVTHNYVPKPYPPVDLNPPYFSYQKDSAYCLLGANVGYINVGVFKRADSLKLKKIVSKASGLIIDNRQNQDETKGTGGGDVIGELIRPEQNAFARFSVAQPTYPGVFTLTAPTNTGATGSKNCFEGKIIILINENTVSVGEFLTMAYQKAPHAKTLGTTTSGADGNVTYITLPGNFFVQFTGLGVYYPNGKETQRAGISPDVTVQQTLKGYTNNENEQLTKAIEWLRKGK